MQIYVNDIIFGSTDEKLYNKFEVQSIKLSFIKTLMAKLMQSKYKMSMMGELTYFLRLQVKQKMMEPL